MILPLHFSLYKQYVTKILNALQGTQYVTKILNAQQQAVDLLDSDSWVKQAGNDELSGIVFAKSTQTYGKVFKLIVSI